MKAGEKMHADFYDNWIYAARKKDMADEQMLAGQLTADSVIGLHSNFRFTIEGEKSISGELVKHSLYNCYKGREYKDAREVIEFLFLIDGKKTVQQLATEYGQRTGAGDPLQATLSLTRFLVREHMITIVKTS
jgi:hypothetical protein